MNAYVFGWNPIRFAWDNLDNDIQKLKCDGKLVDNWSVASHKTIELGGRAYIVRLGLKPKGIFASGYIASVPTLLPVKVEFTIALLSPSMFCSTPIKNKSSLSTS